MATKKKDSPARIIRKVTVSAAITIGVTPKTRKRTSRRK